MSGPTESPIRRFPLDHAPGLEPLPELAELRRHAPVVRVSLPGGAPAWLVTRYADVRQVLAGPCFSRALASRGKSPGSPRATALPDSILATDPPDHSRLRRLIAPALTARRAEAMRRDVARTVRTLLGALDRRPAPVDLVTHFTRPLPLTVICDLLGTDRMDADRLDVWDDTLRSRTAVNAEVTAAVEDMATYLKGLISAKRAHPADDMLSLLIAARDTDDDRLSEGELVSFCVVLLLGGYGTTANRLAGMVHLLLARPERYALLRDEPARVPAAVEELLRYAQAAMGANLRVATEEVTLSGVTIGAGEAVVALMASANHDEDAFPRPDLLDLTREAPAHLSFGHGVHFCAGAQLARVQLQEALTGLTRHFPRLRAAGPAAWKDDRLSRAPRVLPVRW
ncbi:cytochrome P450 [Streptomyces sp. NPDC088182]|uniref:cytochrome P450 n=1 Tax=Streptomyces sp. NPDC088182 TaxID=3365838 RepID=UPI00380E0CA8